MKFYWYINLVYKNIRFRFFNEKNKEICLVLEEI